MSLFKQNLPLGRFLSQTFPPQILGFYGQVKQPEEEAEKAEPKYIKVKVAENVNDIKVGDLIEGYTEKEVARKL